MMTRFENPSARAVLTGSLPGREHHETPTKSKGNVLVVDDAPDIRALISDILTPGCYRVIEAASGPDAFEKIALFGCSIDVLITDLIMPGMTGRTVADTLLAWCPGVEVVFMSGYVDDSQIEHCGKNLHYLHKPFNRKQLMSMVDRVLKKKP